MMNKTKPVYVLVRSTDKSLYQSSYIKTQFAYRKVAERVADKLQKQLGYPLYVMTMDVYNDIYGRATRMVKNLMTGEMVEESINTPYSCSVSSESYWSN